MLCLGRREGQRVALDWCGERIGWVTVVQVHGQHVRLGFDMERHVTITREELERPPVAEATCDSTNPDQRIEDAAADAVREW